VRGGIGRFHRLLLFFSIRNTLGHVTFLFGEKKELTTMDAKDVMEKKKNIIFARRPYGLAYRRRAAGRTSGGAGVGQP
jgi:hypothetical protein